MLRSMSQQILVADIGSYKSVIRLKIMYVVERKEATMEHCQSQKGQILLIGFRYVLVAHVEETLFSL